MTTGTDMSRLLSFAASAVLLVGCGEESTPAEEASSPDTIKTSLAGNQVTLADTRGLFNPKKGEVWTYRVKREVPLTAKLSDRDALKILAKHDSHYELAFERKRVCGGRVQVEGFDGELIRIDIFEDDHLAEQEFYEVNSEGLFGRGWSNQPGNPPIISSSAIPIAVPGMEGGAMWRTAAEDSPKEYKFRVIERMKLGLSAGSFNVAQIQILAGNAMNSLKRTLWFAENVGIVKEITTYYDATSIRIRESSELVKWELPDGFQAASEEDNEFAAEAASVDENENARSTKEEF